MVGDGLTDWQLTLLALASTHISLCSWSLNHILPGILAKISNEH